MKEHPEIEFLSDEELRSKFSKQHRLSVLGCYGNSTYSNECTLVLQADALPRPSVFSCDRHEMVDQLKEHSSAA